MDTRDTGRMTPAPESPDAALVERLRQCADSIAPSPLHLACQEAATTITRLTAERDAALRDAERYRWLREAPDVAGDDLLSQLVRDYADKYLDAAIDSEMARAALSAQERGNV